jgi:hypothetical protein
MVAALYSRAVEDGAVRVVLVQHLALENAAVLERQMENVPVRRVRHRIELHDGRLSVERPKGIAHAAQVAMTSMQTPHAINRLSLRHLGHTSN